MVVVGTICCCTRLLSILPSPPCSPRYKYGYYTYVYIIFVVWFCFPYYFLRPLGGVECHLGSVSATHTPPFNVCFGLLLSVSVSSTGVVPLRGAWCSSFRVWNIKPPAHWSIGILVTAAPLGVEAPRTLHRCGAGTLSPLSVRAPRTLRGRGGGTLFLLSVGALRTLRGCGIVCEGSESMSY